MTEVFRSHAEEIRYHVMQLLDDGKEYTVKMIKHFVKQQTGKEFSDGAFAGSLRDLLKNNPEFSSPRRGVYQKEISIQSDSKDSIFLEDEVIKILKSTINKLFQQVDHLNPLTINEQQQQTINLLKKTISSLNDTIEEIEDLR